MTRPARPFSILIPVLGFGPAGGYRVLSRLADQWLAEGCRVAFLAPYWCDPPYYPTQAELLWVDAWGQVVSHRPGMDPNLSGVAKAGRLIRLYVSLWLGLCRAEGPWDILLANHSLTAWPVALALVGAEKVYYIQAYEPEMYGGRPGIKHRFLQALSWASYFLPLRRVANAPLYLRYRSCRAEAWIPPGLDMNVFRPAGTPDGARTLGGGGGLVVGCIGRSEPDKGTREAIAAYRAFVRQHPGPHRLRMATFGVPPAWLEGIPGLEPVVPGNDRELADYYRSLDVLLALCTIQHGAHHYPVLEAMASDLGVVTTGYTPADSGNAWIVGADPEEAAAALAAILADPERTREKLGNAQTAILAYDWPRVASRFLTFLASVCGKQGGVP